MMDVAEARGVRSLHAGARRDASASGGSPKSPSARRSTVRVDLKLSSELELISIVVVFVTRGHVLPFAV